MTVAALTNALGLLPVAVSDAERRVTGGYAGDLLSWVMGRAEQNAAWITIMSNVNVVAVAQLTDVSCVILAEGVTLDPDAAAQAKSRGVNVLSSELPAFELCARVRALL